MVKDIHTKTDDAAPFEKTVLNGTLLFRASDTLFNNELWKTDGTTAGTAPVKDIHPNGSSFLEELTPLNGVALFQADDGTHGQELWKTDGTTAGTFLVQDLHPGEEDSSPEGLVRAGGAIAFYADDGVHGKELWVSDGTVAGTVLVKDIRPGSEGAISEWPDRAVAIDGALYFIADDGARGAELWVSDGTAAGTVLVHDVYPGPGGSMSNLRWDPAIAGLAGAPLFTADDGVHGVELWASDGSAAGAHMVLDINPLHNCGFSKTDPCGSHPNFLGVVNGMVLFSANDGPHGRELWASDGTVVGTALVKDIHPGSSNSGPSSATVIRDTLFFRAGDDVHGIELWKSDGTEQGTVMVKDIHPGASSSLVYDPVGVDGVLYFSAWDGVHGQELWTSDGTEAGTCMVADLNLLDGAYPRDLVDWEGRLFFTADDGFVGDELWTLWEPRRIYLPILRTP